MEEPLILLGFLALKAEQYARFPSISKVSDDWHQIAMIAAKGYNALRAHDEMVAQNEWLRRGHCIVGEMLDVLIQYPQQWDVQPRFIKEIVVAALAGQERE